MLWPLLTLNSSILRLIWSGTAYFVVNYTNTFLPGDHDRRARWRTCATHFFCAKPQALRHKTFIFSLSFICMICFYDYKFLFLNNECRLQWETSYFNGFLHQADRCTNFPRFQGAQRDHVRVQSSSCCFPGELVSFIRPRELERFNPRHVTRSPPIRIRIWVGRCNNSSYTYINLILFLI